MSHRPVMRPKVNHHHSAMGIKPHEKESNGGPNHSTDARSIRFDDRGPSGGLTKLKRWRSLGGQGELRVQVTSTVAKSCFCSFIEQNSKDDVVGFFTEVVSEVEEKMGVLDYHLKVREQKQEQQFRVDIFYGKGNFRKGLDEVRGSAECISCFPGAPLYPDQEPGATAGECVLAEFNDQPHVQCSLNPRARAGFVVSPVRHVERMSELQDDELFALWSTAVRALRQDSLRTFDSMLLNQGNYSNFPHLRLKVMVDDLLHEQLRLKWSSEKLELWNRLLVMAEKTPDETPCYFFHKTGMCRAGEQCRFSHTQKNSDI